jgi:hypothetical protein
LRNRINLRSNVRLLGLTTIGVAWALRFMLEPTEGRQGLS